MELIAKDREANIYFKSGKTILRETRAGIKFFSSAQAFFNMREYLTRALGLSFVEEKMI